MNEFFTLLTAALCVSVASVVTELFIRAFVVKKQVSSAMAGENTIQIITRDSKEMKGFLFLLLSLLCAQFVTAAATFNTTERISPPPVPAGDTMFFDLAHAVITPSASVTYYDLPVYITSVDQVTSFDFWFHFNQADLTYFSTISVISQLDTYSHFNTNNQFLSNTTSGPSIAYTIPNNATLVYVRFKMASKCTIIDSTDFSAVTTLLNGGVSHHAFVSNQGAQISGIPSLNCTGSTIPFSFPNTYAGNTVTSWAWNFSNGSSSDQQVATVTFFDPDIYTATVSIHTANGCDYQFNRTFTVDESPTVFFTTAINPAQDTVFFTNSSTPAHYSWDFDDDNAFSSDTNTSHYYSNGGGYSVKLTATTNAGCTGTYSVLTNVDKPRTGFHAQNGCTGTAIPFSENSVYPNGSLTNWSWDFGDGGTSTVRNPQHIYNFPGTFTVVLTVTGSNGLAGISSQQVSVGTVPVLQFVADRLSGCADLSVIFNNTSVADSASVYAWDFGDGDTSDDINAEHIYTDGGTYPVELIVTTLQGCSDTLRKPAYIHTIARPVADFGNSGACLNGNVDFTDKSTSTDGLIVSWEWDFGGMGTAFTASPSTTFNADGTYTVTLQVMTDQGCNGFIAKDVIVSEKPVPAFSATELSGCSPLADEFVNTSTLSTNASFTWKFGDGATSNLKNTSHTYVQNGNIDVTLVVVNPGGCSDSLTKHNYIAVFSGVTPAFSDTSRCALTATEFTDETVLTIGNIASWNWNFGDGNSSTSQNPTYVYNNPGTYQVSLTVQSDLGCSGVIIKTLEIDSKPSVHFTVSNPDGCAPFPVNFENLTLSEPGSNYQWSFGDNTSFSGAAANHIYQTTGNYTVKLVVSTSEGCTDSLQIADYIQLLQPPVANYTLSDTTVTIPNSEVSFTNQSQNYSTVLWDFGNDYFSDLENPEYIFADTGKMTVCLEATNLYGCTDTACHAIVVSISRDIVLPGAFSPNGDHTNDILFVQGGPVKTLLFRVFNEWGNLLFESTAQETGWDGTRHGTPQPAGTYEYTIAATTIDGTEVNLYGAVQLTR